ncbi:MAG: NAD(+) diphosphatase [Clostridiales bacterium]|nr:NAD(+) diphosphatase [Clostridiales bacterium]
MIQDIGEHRFHNEYRMDVVPKADSRILFYRGREIFVKCDDSGVSFLRYEQLVQKCPHISETPVFLFSIDGIDYFLYREYGAEHAARNHLTRTEPDDYQVDEWDGRGLQELFPGFTWEKIDRMRAAEPKEAVFAGVTGMQLYGWYKSRRFCPACGRPMVHGQKERMMHCETCGQIEYPKICPAVIVAVTNQDRILLTKYAGRDFKKYALIAGFAEIGETIEETVAREVMEEVGLKIKNIRYYKSQPWSFTDTLLMGFFAEVDGSDTISLDQTELSEGKWCTKEEVPEDDGVSLTREMMGVFKNGNLNRIHSIQE